MIQLGMCTGVVRFEVKNHLCFSHIVSLNYYYSPADFDIWNARDKNCYLI